MLRSSRIKVRLSQTLWISFAETMYASKIKFIHHMPNYARLILTDHFLTALWTCRAHHGSADCCSPGQYAKLTGPSPSKSALTSAHSFAKLSPQAPAAPAIGRGRIKEKANTRCLGGSCKASLLELDCCSCIWRLFLETSKKQHWAVPAAGARMCFRTCVFGCGEASPLEAQLLPMQGKVNVQKHHTPN